MAVLIGPDRLITDTSPSAAAWSGRRRGLGLLAALATVFLGLGLVEAWLDAPTFDEPVSLAAGLTALTRHDLRLNDEHPPLAKALSALPALLAQPQIPRGLAWASSDDASFTTEFLTTNNEAGSLRRTVFLSRLVPLAMAVLTGFALYALGTRLFNPVAGAAAGAAWLTLPPVLGFGHLNGLDIPFTLATVGTVLLADRFLERPDRRRTLALGLATGACLLTRTSGVIVLVVVLLAVGIASRRQPWLALGRVGLVALVAWATLWAGYRVLAPSGSELAIDAPETLMPLPAEYRAGLADQTLFGDGAHRSFVLGDYEATSGWRYWPASLVVKLPVTTVAFLAIGGFALWRQRNREDWLRLAVVGALAVALAAGTVAGARPVGMRYLLPSLALGLVLAAAGVSLVLRHRHRLAAAGLALAAQFALLVGAAPHSLAWTAIPSASPWQLGADSNFEWGQDFYRLQVWSEGREPLVAWGGPMKGGWIPGARPLIGTEVEVIRGWVAVSATTLTVYAHDELAWLRAYCPVDDLGGTVLLYWFASPPTSAPGPETPPAECEGETSTRAH